MIAFVLADIDGRDAEVAELIDRATALIDRSLQSGQRGVVIDAGTAALLDPELFEIVGDGEVCELRGERAAAQP
jgi:hypothetical protein